MLSSLSNPSVRTASTPRVAALLVTATLLFGVVAPAALGTLPGGGGLAQAFAEPSIPTFTFSGEGYGHGIGLSQYGAINAAKAGLSAEQIIKHYYTGVALQSRSSANVKVNLSASKATKSQWQIRPGSAGSTLSISGVDGGATAVDQTYTFSVVNGQVAVTGSNGLSAQNLGASVTVRPNGGSPSLLQVVTSSGPQGYSNVRYRGELVLSVNGGALKLVNIIGMEEYLYGVVPRELGNVFNPLPAASQAQALVARSYAYSSVQNGTELYCTVSSQVYNGHSRFTSDSARSSGSATMHEETAANAAVDATRGLYVTYGGSVIPAYFSSSNGTRTANNEDIWGGTARAYLRGVADPYYPTSQNWVKTYNGMSLGNLLKSRSGSPAGAGTTVWVSDVKITYGAGGWAKAMDVVWSNGSTVRYTTGDRVRIYLGLRSAKFTMAGGSSAPVVTVPPVTYEPPVVGGGSSAPSGVPVQGPIAAVEKVVVPQVDPARIAEIRKLLGELAPELAEAAKATTALLDQVEALKASEATSRAKLGEISARYDEQQKDLAILANSYYHVGIIDMLDMLLSAETFGEFVMRGEYLVSQLEDSAKLVADITITRRELESEQANLAKVLTETEAKWSAALTQEQALRAEQASLQSELR